jgi:hypothetical protein
VFGKLQPQHGTVALCIVATVWTDSDCFNKRVHQVVFSLDYYNTLKQRPKGENLKTAIFGLTQKIEGIIVILAGQIGMMHIKATW